MWAARGAWRAAVRSWAQCSPRSARVTVSGAHTQKHSSSRSRLRLDTHILLHHGLPTAHAADPAAHARARVAERRHRKGAGERRQVAARQRLVGVGAGRRGARQARAPRPRRGRGGRREAQPEGAPHRPHRARRHHRHGPLRRPRRVARGVGPALDAARLHAHGLPRVGAHGRARRAGHVPAAARRLCRARLALRLARLWRRARLAVLGEYEECELRHGLR
jgi:hypothetical protein